MHRTEGDGHVDNLFDPWDPFIPRPATMVTHEWCNAVQEELANTVEGLDGTLNTAATDTTPNQLLARLNAKFGRLDLANVWASNQSVGGFLAVTGTSLLTGALTANGGATFNGVTTGPGLAANGGPTNGAGLTATGVGSGAGVTATGGATGNGITAAAGATSGNGGAFTGRGASAGVAATGGATGSGVTGQGGSTSGAGGTFTAGPNSAGVVATGGANGNGATLTGAGTGYGAVIVSGATGDGATITSVATSGTGAIITGGTGGVGLRARAGTAASATVPTYDIVPERGYIAFADAVVAPNSNVALKNTIAPTSIVKARGRINLSGGTPTVASGMNVTSAVIVSGNLVITFAQAFANTNFSTLATGSSVTVASVEGGSETTTTVTIFARNYSGASQSLAAETMRINFVCYGEQ